MSDSQSSFDDGPQVDAIGADPDFPTTDQDPQPDAASPSEQPSPDEQNQDEDVDLSDLP